MTDQSLFAADEVKARFDNLVAEADPWKYGSATWRSRDIRVLLDEIRRLEQQIEDNQRNTESYD